MTPPGPRVLVVSHFDPAPVGHGGNHRTYQVVHDLIGAFGADAVRFVPARPAQTDAPAHSTLPVGSRAVLTADRVRRRIGRAVARERPGAYSVHRFAHPDLLRRYTADVRAATGPTVCVIEHTGLSALLPINRRAGIPTIACPQNLESLDTVAPGRERRPAAAASRRLSAELEVLAQCAAVLCISPVETALVGAVSGNAAHYPYVPVGEIATRLRAVAQRRACSRLEPGHFLLLGSATHEAAAESMEWFLDSVRRYGLPAGVRVTVAGNDTERLRRAERADGVHVAGTLGQDALDDALTRVQALLVPHRRGFGAVTRIAEAHCAGVPCIASAHSVHMLGGADVTVAGDTWAEWAAAMAALSRGAATRATSGRRAAADPSSNPLSNPLAAAVARALCTTG